MFYAKSDGQWQYKTLNVDGNKFQNPKLLTINIISTNDDKL